MASARTVKNVSPHEFVKGYSAQRKRCGKTSVRKTKFEEYIEMDSHNVVASAEEDLELERKLAKKLKVKGGKLGGEDDGINVLFRGIPSIIDSLGKEGTPSAEEFPNCSPKRKKRKKMKSLDQGLESEVADDSGLGVSESLETCDAYMLREIPAKSPSRMNRKKIKVLEQGQDGDTVADTAVGASRPAVSCVAEVVLEEVPAKVPTGKRDGKYIAPHLRVRSSHESEEYTKIRRHIRGLLNRLSESNVESITGEISTILLSIARAAASQIVSEEILASCSGGPRSNEQLRVHLFLFILNKNVKYKFRDEYLLFNFFFRSNGFFIVTFSTLFNIVCSSVFTSCLGNKSTECIMKALLSMLMCPFLILSVPDVN